MSSTLAIPCPECGHSIRLPAAARGKKVRCKQCEAVFVVPAEEGADPQTARPPATVKKPVVVPTTPPPTPPTSDIIGFAKDEDDKKDDDDEDNPTPFKVVITDEVARCPHCAKELDPPDTKVCLNCGYDLVVRRRHATKTVIGHTADDYLNWWLPAFIWIFAMLVVLGVEIFLIRQMSNIVRTDLDFLVKDDKTVVTGTEQYYLSPDCFTTCFSVITLAVMIFGVQFSVRRLIYNWKPPEVEDTEK